MNTILIVTADDALRGRLVSALGDHSVFVAQSDPEIPPFPGLRLTALRAVKILGSARPGEVIRLEAQVTGRLGNLVQVRATASVGGALVLEAELTLSGTKTRI